MHAHKKKKFRTCMYVFMYLCMYVPDGNSLPVMQESHQESNELYGGARSEITKIFISYNLYIYTYIYTYIYIHVYIHTYINTAFKKQSYSQNRIHLQ